MKQQGLLLRNWAESERGVPVYERIGGKAWPSPSKQNLGLASRR
jgi:hypothetical protein